MVLSDHHPHEKTQMEKVNRSWKYQKNCLLCHSHFTAEHKLRSLCDLCHNSRKEMRELNHNPQIFMGREKEFGREIKYIWDQQKTFSMKSGVHPVAAAAWQDVGINIDATSSAFTSHAEALHGDVERRFPFHQYITFEAQIMRKRNLEGMNDDTILCNL